MEDGVVEVRKVEGRLRTIVVGVEWELELGWTGRKIPVLLLNLGGEEQGSLHRLGIIPTSITRIPSIRQLLRLRCLSRCRRRPRRMVGNPRLRRKLSSRLIAVSIKVKAKVTAKTSTKTETGDHSLLPPLNRSSRPRLSPTPTTTPAPIRTHTPTATPARTVPSPSPPTASTAGATVPPCHLPSFPTVTVTASMMTPARMCRSRLVRACRRWRRGRGRLMGG